MFVNAGGSEGCGVLFMILSLWAEIWFFDFSGLGPWRIFKICAFRGSFLCEQRLGKEFLDADEVANLLYL